MDISTTVESGTRSIVFSRPLTCVSLDGATCVTIPAKQSIVAQEVTDWGSFHNNAFPDTIFPLYVDISAVPASPGYSVKMYGMDATCVFPTINTNFLGRFRVGVANVSNQNLTAWRHASLLEDSCFFHEPPMAREIFSWADNDSGASSAWGLPGSIVTSFHPDTSGIKGVFFAISINTNDPYTNVVLGGIMATPGNTSGTFMPRTYYWFDTDVANTPMTQINYVGDFSGFTPDPSIIMTQSSAGAPNTSWHLEFTAFTMGYKWC